MECDASLMDGDSGMFGGVGAVPGTHKSSHINLVLILVEWLKILYDELYVDQVSEMLSKLLLCW